jgi:hypothetical protein
VGPSQLGEHTRPESSRLARERTHDGKVPFACPWIPPRRRPRPDSRPRLRDECSDAGDDLAEVRAALEVERGLGHGVRGKNSIDHRRQRQALEAPRQRIEVARAAYEDLVDADQ